MQEKRSNPNLPFFFQFKLGMSTIWFEPIKLTELTQKNEGRSTVIWFGLQNDKSGKTSIDKINRTEIRIDRLNQNLPFLPIEGLRSHRPYFPLSTLFSLIR